MKTILKATVLLSSILFFATTQAQLGTFSYMLSTGCMGVISSGKLTGLEGQWINHDPSSNLPRVEGCPSITGAIGTHPANVFVAAGLGTPTGTMAGARFLGSHQIPAESGVPGEGITLYFYSAEPIYTR